MGKFGEQVRDLGEKGRKGLLNLNGKQTKYVTWGVYFVIALVVLSMLNNTLFSSKNINTDSEITNIPQKPQVISRTETDIGLLEEEMEGRLASTLSMIQGAGKVAVNISLASGTTNEYATNVTSNVKTTQEQTNGGSRVVDESLEEAKLVMARNQSNNESPVIIRENKPLVQGVLVVAEGASDPRVRIELNRAVETALGVASYQVHVVPMER